MAEVKDALNDSGRQPSSVELRSEIERTRAEMDRTFDALESKMTPGQILEEVWYLTRGGTKAGASKLWQVAKEHPLPATVIGVGLGWLMVESSRGNGGVSGGYDRARGGAGRTNWGGRTSLYDSSAGYGVYPETYNNEYQESWETSDQHGGVSGRVSSAAGSVKHAASHAKDSVVGAASSAADSISDAASTAREKVSDVAGSVRHRASDLSHTTREKASNLRYTTRQQARRAQTGFWQMMEENPLAVGVATLALGVLGGLALPSTRKEDELLGETRDRVLDQIQEVGQEALEKGKQVAETAVETLKEEAGNAGLTASGIADKVREVGNKTKDAVKEEVKGAASGSEGSSGSQGSASTSGTSGMTTGGVTTPSATTGTTAGSTSGASGSRGRNTPRETITPVESELTNKR